MTTENPVDIIKTKEMPTPTLTHPEWDKETGGLEVAKAFAHQIREKKGR
jgi:hypothetical protein